MRFQFSIRDLLFLVAILALAAGWWVDHQRISKMEPQKWEYKTGPMVEQYLVGNGTEGWEVCGVERDEDRHYTTVIYKRPKK
jgi:hypothetical protein